MNVYVESNFVLELALVQEQSASCEAILTLAEESRVRLIVPAYSLAEPYETLTRRQRQRKRLKQDLDDELKKSARTATHAGQLGEFTGFPTLLITLADEDSKRLDDVRSRLIEAAEIIPLDASVLAAGTRYQHDHDFSAQDALVYSSVLSHLRRVRAPESCFLNRNSKDFDDPDIVNELASHGCKFFPGFTTGHSFIEWRLGILPHGA